MPEIKELYEKDERYRQLLDYSSTLEGLSRHSSVHAAGVVIAPGPLDEYVPICTQSTKGAGGSGESIIVTQYDMTCLEKAGMLKMDFLGLKTLTVIYDTVADIRRRYGALKHPVTGEVYARPEDIPLDDPEPYAMMARGGTAGVFQFESQLATEKIRQMKADRFDDLIAANALLRPGPLDMGMDMVFIRRKLGQEEVKYPFPELETVLEPTQGVIVYQEQVMRIVQILGGLSPGRSGRAAKGGGQEGRGPDRQGAGQVHRKGGGEGVSRASGSRTWRTRSRRSAATASTSRTPPRTRWWRTRRRGSRCYYPGRVHGRAHVVGRGQDRRRGVVHRPVPRDGALHPARGARGDRGAGRRT